METLAYIAEKVHKALATSSNNHSTKGNARGISLEMPTSPD